MGVILAKFRKEKSTQEVLEALQEKIDTLEAYTVNTQEQKKRIVGNFLAVSIGAYVIAFVAFYFIYFPQTWQKRIMYFVPLLLFPIIIILLRYLFTWYFQRKLNKNSKKLTALRAEKKKILEQVMDKETYKVAVNLLARFADKPGKTTFALSPATPSKLNQPLLNRSSTAQNSSQRSNQLALISTPQTRISSTTLGSTTTTPRITTHLNSPRPPALATQMAGIGNNQQLRRRTPFPIVNQQEKGVFDRIVDVLIGDGPQDRFAMICKECYSHNGMALKEDFEYTTFRCAFCNTLNQARKARPVAPRLSALTASAVNVSDSSDSEDDKEDSDDELPQAVPPSATSFIASDNTDNQNNALAEPSSPSSNTDDDECVKQETKNLPDTGTLNAEPQNPSNKSFDELFKQLEKSDSAIDDTSP
ncbi:hypothetical protein DOY81_000372 [Sarcophaga bullata]|nr:hypothetical protein DOY81_000372 [Sarcophaga bullata]